MTPLEYMRAITGLTETPGGEDNPLILMMRDTVARIYPDMADYAALYTGDDVAWCGLAMAYVMSLAGYRPPFGPTDTDKWMWAQSWSQFGKEIDDPVQGCVVVMTREGGGHVTLYERTEGNYYVCRGGNQSDMVNESKFAISSVISLQWPPDLPLPGPGPAPDEHPELENGDEGPAVEQVQAALGLPVDGDFGSITEAGVKGFQRAWAVPGGADGIVGDKTWEAIDDLNARMAAGDDGISDELAAKIDKIVTESPVREYEWNGRGLATWGYYAGMAKTFALALQRLDENDPAVQIMAEASNIGDEDTDALAWYDDEFEDEGMNNSESGEDTLRHLFVMLTGLGMRESSGNPWEGRDMSASNVESDTCEAGLFQSSWNLSNAASEIDDLFQEYKADPNGFHLSFAKGWYPSTANLDNYGSGDGCMYQWLAKFSPAFAVLMTAVGLRVLRQHWGPINRHEVEIVPLVDDMLIDVQRATQVPEVA